MNNYRFWNNALGWTTFVVALVTYTLTLEPTVSFWDCGEYITTSVKLEVGHPPGAPVFQLIANVMSQLALGDVTQQAYWVNFTSGLSSALSIPFLFWTITMLAKKLVRGEESLGQNIAVLGSGLVGALAFTWSDSFWYSAVEGEVYAMSSFFTAAAFWAALKWEASADHDLRANRWLLLVAYLTGLSVGVHILVFLTIPAVVMIYFYKSYPKVTWKTWVVANAVSVFVLALVFAVIIPVILRLFGFFEITAVNSLGLPKNTGSVLMVLALVAGVYFGIRWAVKTNRPLVEQAILGVVMLLIGYSSFVVLAIRSNANTPIDENNPEDAMSLLAYYNREQYGDWPVLYGQSFNSKLDSRKPYTDGSPSYLYSETTGKYEVVNDGKAAKPNYAKSDVGFFPRMWSDQADHVQNYQRIFGANPDKKITFAEHFRYFMDYQVGQMWFRYFMWNFAGRQNDDQNRYELINGNWMTGIDFIDEMRLGPQSNLPDSMQKQEGRNYYYALPLLLGLLGLWFQAKRDQRNAWVITLLFLFTGLAIVVYTNHKPFEPRERDYAFVGSFYVFAIWVGLGVVALYELLAKYRSTALALGVTVLTLGIPTLMVAENWDDHDRSNRYTARDIAKMYLDSCEPNAILFTNGDNDTFPLWYVQEVEGYRTDVRIVNLSLLNTDWYIDMMKRKFYDSDPVPFTFEKSEYVQGTRDVLYFQDMGLKGRWYVQDFLDYAKRSDDGVMFTAFAGTDSPKKLPFFPMKNFRVPINKADVMKAGLATDSAAIPDYIDWNWGSSIVAKRDLMLIDLIAHNDWSRPIYFSTTVGSSASAFFWLQDYLQLEGLAYRFVPFATPGAGNGFEFGAVNTEKCYNLMVNPEGVQGKFNFGNMEVPNVFLDETVRRSTFNLRATYARTANALARAGQNEKALEVLNTATAKMPVSKLGYDYFTLGLIEGYYVAGDATTAAAMVEGFTTDIKQRLDYFGQFKGKQARQVRSEVEANLQYLQMLARMNLQYTIGMSLTQEAYMADPLVQMYEQYARQFGVSQQQ
ncbi:MAG: DUF2723 domain-containing protein [Schleiferiaceae bacterium]